MTPRLWLYVGTAGIVAGAFVVQGVRISSLKRQLAESELSASQQREAAVSAAVEYMRQQLEAANRLAQVRQGILNDELTKRQALEADVASARAAGASLRDAAKSAARRCQASSRPADAASGTPTTDTGMVFADVLGRLEARVVDLAELADRRGLAGSVCELERDSLSSDNAP